MILAFRLFFILQVISFGKDSNSFATSTTTEENMDRETDERIAVENAKNPYFVSPQVLLMEVEVRFVVSVRKGVFIMPVAVIQVLGIISWGLHLVKADE